MTEVRPVLETPERAFLYKAAVEEPARYSRHRYELPLLSVFLSLALLELVVVHLLLSMWSQTAAWILTALSIVAVVQIAFLIRGMVQYPTEIMGRSIHVRHGAAGRIVVPLANLERADDVAFAPEEKGPGVFRATLMASPNIALRLREPLRVRKREVSTIMLRLDDPERFLAELAARREALA